MKRKILWLTVFVLAAYCAYVYAAWRAMLKPPVEFSRFMMKVPGPMLYLIPFPPLWKDARAGSLRYGDPAPEIDLPMVGAPNTRVRLSENRGVRPVVLIFGSYT